jgi:hypothetical protein
MLARGGLLATAHICRYGLYPQIWPISGENAAYPQIWAISRDMSHIRRYAPYSGIRLISRDDGSYLQICLVSRDVGVLTVRACGSGGQKEGACRSTPPKQKSRN